MYVCFKGKKVNRVFFQISSYSMRHDYFREILDKISFMKENTANTLITRTGQPKTCLSLGFQKGGRLNTKIIRGRHFVE